MGKCCLPSAGDATARLVRKVRRRRCSAAGTHVKLGRPGLWIKNTRCQHKMEYLEINKTLIYNHGTPAQTQKPKRRQQ